MRDVFIVTLVACALPYALLHTWFGVLLWTWLSIMNPHKLAFGFAYNAPLAAAAAIVTLLSMVVTRDKLRMAWDPPVLMLIAFLGWMCVTTALAVSPELAWPQLNKVLKIQMMTLVAIAALRERKHIDWFVWVIVLSIGFYGVKGGIWTILTGGGARVWGPPGGFFEDNNALGTTLVIAIPLMNYLRIVATRTMVKHVLLAMMGLCAVAALGTQSRGGLLAIVAMGFFLWVRSSRKFITGTVIVVLAVLLVSFMPASWEARMRTIDTYQEEGSAIARLESWKFSFNLANDKFFGGGFNAYTPENYARYNPESALPQAAHSIYFSVLAEHGYVGLTIFLLIWFLAFGLIARLRRKTKGIPEAQWAHSLASMCQVALIGYAVGGAFLSLAYFDLPYNIVVMLVVANRWVDTKSWTMDERVAGETPPFAALHGR